jgi:hypothetical protein
VRGCSHPDQDIIAAGASTQLKAPDKALVYVSSTNALDSRYSPARQSRIGNTRRGPKMSLDFGSHPDRRLKSDRHDVNNDTGRVAFCGPYVIAAITGVAVSRVEDEIRTFRDLPRGAQPVIKGTYTEDVTAALRHFGYTMKPVQTFMHFARKQRPSVWTWMHFPRNAWAHYILAIHKGKEGHWILIKGVKLCDTFSQGRWEFVCDGPHKGARIMEVFEVKRAIEF